MDGALKKFNEFLSDINAGSMNSDTLPNAKIKRMNDIQQQSSLNMTQKYLRDINTNTEYLHSSMEQNPYYRDTLEAISTGETESLEDEFF